MLFRLTDKLHRGRCDSDEIEGILSCVYAYEVYQLHMNLLAAGLAWKADVMRHEKEQKNSLDTVGERRASWPGGRLPLFLLKIQF